MRKPGLEAGLSLIVFSLSSHCLLIVVRVTVQKRVAVIQSDRLDAVIVTRQIVPEERNAHALVR